ncbi:MAG: hypothetical protein EB101_01415 [Chitinophagia bacterium]|nr:hypothetical protein [Chitinophagia bacterium]
MNQVNRRVICLPKTGSSFVANVFSSQNAVHEFDFPIIADHALHLRNNYQKTWNYLKNRSVQLNGKIDVSTSLIFFLNDYIELIGEPSSIFLVRDPFEWIYSMIKYAYKVMSIGELTMDDSWRIDYGRLFVGDMDWLEGLLHPKTGKRYFVKSIARKLLETWLVYTQQMVDSASRNDINLSNLFLTSQLSSIDFFETTCRLFDLHFTPPLSLFVKLNTTNVDDEVADELARCLPWLYENRLLNLSEIDDYLRNCETMSI